MSTKFENKYASLKNYELESMFELSKKQKEQLESRVDPKTKHNFKLQEFYLKTKVCDFNQLEEEVLAYLEHNEYLLDNEQIGKFYELLAFAAVEAKSDKEIQYLNLAVEKFPTNYCLKRVIYNALTQNNLYLAARLMLIAIEADLDFDDQLSYYNLVVEHFFEDEIEDYYQLMNEFQTKFISVNNITIQFSFNKLVANYYIQKHIKQSDETVILKAKKAVNEQLLKAITSMKDEDELRSEVLRVREAIKIIDGDNAFDIFELLTFNLLPVPKGTPESSPLNKIR